MNADFIHKNSCRICGQSDFVKILDLGEMPPANAFLRKEDLDKPEPKFPLAVYFCKNCGLLQLLDIVNPEILFRHYTYLISASEPLVNHFTQMAHNLAKRFIKSKDDLVVEIGGNDGSLLFSIKDQCRVLNVEPARNIALISKERGIETIDDFFGEALAKKILENYGLAKLIIANNVIAHIDDLKSVFRGVELLLPKDGAFIFEVHWVGNLIGAGGFDQIYHEHLSYFSLSALQRLVSQFSLKIFDVEGVPIHGESLRIYVGKNQSVADGVQKFLDKEKTLALDRIETYQVFARKVRSNKNDLRLLLLELKAEGRKIVGYGAPAKGNTLLNYFEIDDKILDFITDTTPFKQGTYSPGMHIPIYHPDKIKEIKPDYILLLAWNYADAILKKEGGLRQAGIKFIIPVPEVKIV